MVTHEMPNGIEVRKSVVNRVFCKLRLLGRNNVFHEENLSENNEKCK